MPTVEDNASADVSEDTPLDEHGNPVLEETEEAHQPEANEVEDDITSHPKFQELEKKYSAAHAKMDANNIEWNEIRDEYVKLKEEKGEEPKTLTPTEDDTDFKIFNAEEIKLVSDEFKSYKEKGYTNEDSLRLAKLDKGLTETSVNDQVRQSPQAPSVTDRSGDNEALTESQKQAIAAGVNPETVKKYKDLVEG